MTRTRLGRALRFAFVVLATAWVAGAIVIVAVHATYPAVTHHGTREQ